MNNIPTPVPTPPDATSILHTVVMSYWPRVCTDPAISPYQAGLITHAIIRPGGPLDNADHNVPVTVLVLGPEWADEFEPKDGDAWENADGIVMVPKPSFAPVVTCQMSTWAARNHGYDSYEFCQLGFGSVAWLIWRARA